jgi:hypothetical protein
LNLKKEKNMGIWADKEYVERADFIDVDDLLKWTVENRHFENIQYKLIGPRPVLIAGPRGSGKTHQMKLVHNKCLKDSSKPLAVYVTYGKYYHLEPFLFKEANAINIFHTWVLGKILLGCQELQKDLDEDFDDSEIEGFGLLSELRQFVSQLEKGQRDERYDEWVRNITIINVVRHLENTARKFKRKRVILLLDDAALTLTPEYMKEFFDVFRGLRTRTIAPKASVYPGTTEYGPGFHVGHDAEKVGIWFNLECLSSNYDAFMDELVNKRLPGLREELSSDIIDLFKYASFGLPRAFINLLRSYREKEGRYQQERLNKVIDDQADLIKAEYLSLGSKMPQYKTIIDIGFRFFQNIVDTVKDVNKKRLHSNKGNKQITIGIQRENNLKLDRMITFLNEAGLLYETEPVKHGDKREYSRYIPHLLFLIKERAFSAGKGFDSAKVLEYIKSKSEKHPLRRKFDTLLTEEEIGNIKLDLPPCGYCGTERVTEGQRFCHHCGKELVDKSKFESCMEIKIEDLPITPRQKQIIEEQTPLRTVGDIISTASPGTELQKGHYIGKKRSEKILEIVTQTVEEFLT